MATPFDYIPAVLDRAGRVVRVPVENEIRVLRHFSVGPEHKCGSIQVKIGAAVIAVHIPAQPDRNAPKPGIAFRQVNFLPFFQ